jgi:phosphatidylserine/phosphatidylglycerophosphate/cardiolipin synthase-like enzyme
MPAFELEFLEDGSQTAEAVAEGLRTFIGEARRSLDIAVYDFHAAEGATASVADAIEAARDRGVTVRVVFNWERVEYPDVRRPPISDPEEIDGLEVPTRGVRGDGSLMHHKYVVRDGEVVWTGSTNWTDDAFHREENVIVRVASRDLATSYAGNFRQLWDRTRVRSSGGRGRTVRLEGTLLRPYFSPKGPLLSHVAASFLGTARRRVRLLSPVVTSGPILGTLAELAGRARFDLTGAYDLTQMEEVQSQWASVPANHWKLEAWKTIAPRLSGKRSTPYRKDAVHDYMHAKALVVDDEVITGSYNCSRGGTENAENVLHVKDNNVADRFAEFADRVAVRYRDQA